MNPLTEFGYNVARMLPDGVFYRIRHLLGQGRLPNLSRPKSFNEHILARMGQEPTPVMIQTGDKHEVRRYVADRGFAHLLPAHFASVTEWSDALYDELPQSFVMKGAHGSAMIKFVRNKAEITSASLRALCTEWLDTDYAKYAREKIYNRMTPRVVFEEILADAGGGIPQDYKFYVFNGVCRFVHVDVGRFEGIRRTYFDMNWAELPFKSAHPVAQSIPRPRNFDAMAKAAGELGIGLPFARVDFYDLGERVVLGEITHFPRAGNLHFRPRSADFWAGAFFDES